MDLLGNYGDMSDEEEDGSESAAQNGAGNVAAAASGGLSSLVNYLHDGDGGDDDDSSKGAGDVGITTAPAVRPALSPSPYTQQDSTPSRAALLGRSGLSIRSKPATPAGNSPAMRETAASDVEDGVSPVISSSTHTAAHAIAELQPISESRLPPAPTGEINPTVIKNVQHYMKLSEGTWNNGKLERATVNDDLRDKKEFHNPGILEFLMNCYQIKETGTNYPKELFDPQGYACQMYYDALRRADLRQQAEQKANRTVVDFVSGGAQAGASQSSSSGSGFRPIVQHVTVPASAPAAPAPLPPTAPPPLPPGTAPPPADGGPRKKTKWDQAKRDTFVQPLVAP